MASSLALGALLPELLERLVEVEQRELRASELLAKAAWAALVERAVKAVSADLEDRLESADSRPLFSFEAAMRKISWAPRGKTAGSRCL